MSTAAEPATARAPWWRRAGSWIALGAVLIVGGVVIGATTGTTDRPLDPTSAADDGSLALARLAHRYGTTLTATGSITTAAVLHPDVIVVLDPDAYSDAQLHRISRAAARTVFVRPGVRATRALGDLEPRADDPADPDPGCSLPAARAAGAVELPSDARVYSGTGCYGGLVALPSGADGGPVVLGSSQVLQNDHLADQGVAALDLNLITDDRTAADAVWLSPGADAAGSGAASIWDLFPDGAYRAFVWLLLVGVLVVLWRARRLGPPVAERLPVVVRAVELVEGHGRLYRRANALDRAAGALRAATTVRLAAALGLPRGASALQVGAAAAPVTGRTPAELHQVLAGDVPSDDAALVRLARALQELEHDVRDRPMRGHRP